MNTDANQPDLDSTDREQLSDVVRYNQSAWDRMAEAGDRFYRAVTTSEVDAARRGDFKIRLTPTKGIPKSWLGDIDGKDILCLAGGGARQAPLLAAAGGNVTVFDLSEKQLARDREVASREALEIATITGDMRDLSHFDVQQFDLIISPCATCFCPTLQEIWNESFRVLRGNGRLMVGFINPIHFVFDAAKLDKGKFVVRHSIPYSDFDLDPDEREKTIGPERPLEFGHSLEAIIGGQLAAGFSMMGFMEDGWGGSDPLSKKINTFFATLMTKPA